MLSYVFCALGPGCVHQSGRLASLPRFASAADREKVARDLTPWCAGCFSNVLAKIAGFNDGTRRSGEKLL